MDAVGHTPVLLKEVLELLAPDPEGTILDGTVGAGGHAEALLKASAPKGRLLGLDRDPQALDHAGRRLAPFGERVLLLHQSYAQIADVLAAHPAFAPITRVLLDLGFSSLELEASGRGFSFRSPEEPLDMRFDPSQEQSAETLLAVTAEDELAAIIGEYGEEPLAHSIARGIVEGRRTTPLTKVSQLVGIIFKAYGRRRYNERSRLHPATRTFQAIRIAVNDELNELRRGLPALLGQLAPGGRLAVITFHSVEDRIVKEFFRKESRGCVCPPELPECRCGHQAQLAVITKHVVTPSAGEQQSNPRSRSAKLRVIQKHQRT